MNADKLIINASISTHDYSAFLLIHALLIYRMIHDFTSVLQELIPEVISSQKCSVNMGPVVNGLKLIVI
jgi:hypothetical protein